MLGVDLAVWRHKYKTLDGKERTIPCIVSAHYVPAYEHFLMFLCLKFLCARL